MKDGVSMNYELKEMSLDLISKELYDMYQDIPLKESGSTNLCNGLPFEAFGSYLEKELARKFQRVSFYDTPTIIYILFVENYPVGYIGLRTEIDENGRKWSGNFYYVIRKSERGKGYGNVILKLALDEFRKMKFNEVVSNASAGNVTSVKVIENNGGVFIKEINGSRYYQIEL